MNQPIGPTIKCPECGFFHPTVKGGCPIAKEENRFTESGLEKKSITEFLSTAEKIILSKGTNISKKQKEFFIILTKSFYELVDEIIKSI
jgi:hypothetical protein